MRVSSWLKVTQTWASGEKRLMGRELRWSRLGWPRCKVKELDVARQGWELGATC